MRKIKVSGGMTSQELTPAEITWADDGAPRSSVFGDIYFAPSDGMAETKHVFLDGIGAPEIWAGRSHVTLAETGFGTGLNFLSAWDLWRRTAEGGARLSYVAVEAFPLTKPDLMRALERFPSLAGLAGPLIDGWPPAIKGVHSLVFDEGRVRLTLLFGDAAEMLSTVVGPVDGWFLDGFAPRSNADMWSPELFQAVAGLSGPETRLATFTVAGIVKRGLADVGFEIEKRPGFGSKRQCLKARFVNPGPLRDPAPWFKPPPYPVKQVRQVAVIGAGIAGLMTGWALRQRGLGVTIYDRADRVMAEASGNPRAILEPWIDVGTSPTSQLSWEASRYALDWYATYGGESFTPCGVRSHSGADGWRARVANGAFLRDDDVELCEDHLYFPRGGMIDTAGLAGILGQELDLRLGVDVRNLEDIEADAVVIAASFGSEALAGVPLELEARRGQVSLIEASDPLAHVMSGTGYATPEFETPEGLRHLIGATFSPADPTTDAWRALRDDDHQANRAAVSDLVTGPIRISGGRVGLRATTTDHMPIMGAVPVAGFEQGYLGLSTGRRGPYGDMSYQPGRYLITGLGARGYLTGPLLAETLARMIMGEPLLLRRPILDMLHPARGIIRAMRRGRR